MNFYIWRDRVVENLLGLADTTYQRLAWTGAIESADGSPDEMVVALLDECAFGRFLSDNRKQFNELQAQRVDCLFHALERYVKTEPDFDGNVDHILASATWRDIVIKARDLYVALCPGARDTAEW